MPHCKSCGSEIKPGKNFCSGCGAPLAGPGTSPPPVPAQTVSRQEPHHSRDKIIIAGVMGAAIIAMIIFIGIPLLQSQGVTSTSLPGSFSPLPAQTDPPRVTMSYTAAASSGPIVYRSGVAYEQVFSRDYDFGLTAQQDVFSYNLQQPPMVIECEMNPGMVTREKLVDIGESSERYITTTYADPNAWLDLKVINADTGRTETTISFSKNYVGMTKQEYTLRAIGNYRFEMAGSLVKPGVKLLVKQ
jgi:zinc-ribbon domain